MTEPRTIPITSDTVIERRTTMKLGTELIDLPEGPALCTDAISLTVITASTNGDEKFILVIAVGNHEGAHLGSLSPMSPTEARNFAASLIAAANEIDGGARG